MKKTNSTQLMQKPGFLVFKIWYSPLIKKLLLFSIIQIIIQALPLIVEVVISYLNYGSQVHPDVNSNYKPLFSSGNNESPFFTMLFLSGTAWISVPSFIAEYEWKKTHATILRFLAYFIGIAILVRTSLFDTSQVQNPQEKSFYAVLIAVILIAALIYITIAHYILLKRVSIRLIWAHQAQFAGIYCAKYAGIFGRYGLKVKINELRPDNHPVNRFEGNPDDFSIVSGIDVIRIIANKQHVRSVLAVVRSNPFVIIAKKKSNINSIQDLKGKIIGIQKDFETEIYFRALVAKKGMDPDTDFTYKECGFDVHEFIHSDIDATIGYIGCEPALLRQENIPFEDFNIADEGLGGYADTIIVREPTLKKEKPMVRAFVDSVIKGWEFAGKNKEVALAFIMHLSKVGNREFQRHFLNRMLTLVEDKNGRLGDEQSLDDWQNMINFLTEMKILKENHKVTPGKIVFDI